MQILDLLKNLDRDAVIIVLILLVLLLQVIHIFLLRRIRKSAGAKPEEDLKQFISNEMNRLRKEIIAFEHKDSLESEQEPVPLIPPTEMVEQKEAYPLFKLEQMEEMESFPVTVPGPEKTGFTPIDTPGETGIKPLPGEMDLDMPGSTLTGSDIQSCVDEYNDAVTDEEKQYRFLEKYRPIRVNVPNALERRRREDIAPVYQSADNGDYWVIELQEMGRTVFAVLPRFNLIIKDSNYKAGAFGEVFDCPDYEDNYRHRIARVIKPAVFEKERAESWRLSSKGRIMLSLE